MRQPTPPGIEAVVSLSPCLSGFSPSPDDIKPFRFYPRVRCLLPIPGRYKTLPLLSQGALYQLSPCLSGFSPSPDDIKPFRFYPRVRCLIVSLSQWLLPIPGRYKTLPLPSQGALSHCLNVPAASPHPQAETLLLSQGALSHCLSVSAAPSPVPDGKNASISS